MVSPASTCHCRGAEDDDALDGEDSLDDHPHDHSRLDRADAAEFEAASSMVRSGWEF